jgi:hypothetical protein
MEDEGGRLVASSFLFVCVCMCVIYIFSSIGRRARSNPCSEDSPFASSSFHRVTEDLHLSPAFSTTMSPSLFPSLPKKNQKEEGCGPPHPVEKVKKYKGWQEDRSGKEKEEGKDRERGSSRPALSLSLGKKHPSRIPSDLHSGDKRGGRER